jgi:hypothetical protein
MDFEKIKDIPDNFRDMRSRLEEFQLEYKRKVNQQTYEEHVAFVRDMLDTGKVSPAFYFNNIHNVAYFNWKLDEIDYFLDLGIDLSKNRVTLSWGDTDIPYDSWVNLRNKHPENHGIFPYIVLSAKSDEEREKLAQIVTPNEILSDWYDEKILLTIAQNNDNKDIHDAIFDKMVSFINNSNVQKKDGLYVAYILSLLNISKGKVACKNNDKFEDNLRLVEIKANPELLENDSYRDVFDRMCRTFVSDYFNIEIKTTLVRVSYSDMFSSPWYLNDYLMDIFVDKVKELHQGKNLRIKNNNFEPEELDELARRIGCNLEIHFGDYVNREHDYKYKSNLILTDLKYITDIDKIARVLIDNCNELKYFLLSEEGSHVVKEIQKSGHSEFNEMINRITPKPKQKRKIGVNL